MIIIGRRINSVLPSLRQQLRQQRQAKRRARADAIKALHGWQGCPQQARARILAALLPAQRAKAVLGLPAEADTDRLAAALAPAYAGRIPLRLARRIALGERPVRLSGGLLTAAEAHRWLMAGAPRPIAWWLAGQLGVPSHPSVAVVRWLAWLKANPERWAAALAERTLYIEGELRRYSLLDLLPLISEQDLASGPGRGVQAVLDRLAARLQWEQLAVLSKDTQPLAPAPEWAGRLPRGVRLLRSNAELVQEGLEMYHCVGDGAYAKRIARGEIFVLSVRSWHGRSTVTLSPDLEILEMTGPANGEPPPRHIQLILAWLYREEFLRALCAEDLDG